MNTFEVIVRKSGITKAITAKKGDNLLAVLRNAGIEVQSPCGGRQTCGKCKAYFIKGHAAISASDRERLSLDDLNRGMRLTCGVYISGPLEIDVPPDSAGMDILTDGGGDTEINIDHQVTKRHLSLAAPSIQDQRSDLKRLQDALGMDRLFARKQLLGEIPDTLRNSNFNVTAGIYKRELISLEVGDTSQKAYGVAADIGTTTVVCYLADLGTGKIVDIESGVNGQTAYGADVISRINFTAEHKDGLRVLKRAVTRQLSAMLSSLSLRNNISLKNIYHMVVAGNTTMTHLFLGVPCTNIALSPYIPAVTDLIEIAGRETDLPIDCYVTVLPGVSGYIGSDITAGILATGLHKMAGYALLIDLGTNGEMAVGNKNGIISCSTAAGPAFEGAKITCGIGGVKGAISRVNFAGGKIYDTIGSAPPVGICGSGVLDIVSELLKYGIADKTGRMADPDTLSLPPELTGRLIKNPKGKQFIIHDNIVFTQADIREVQLAKAAISSGITLLLKEAGIGYKDLRQVFVAGGFGNYMSVESALNTGILPASTAGIIKSVGNSAGAGARMCLLSRQNLEEIRAISRMTQYIELSGRPDFEEYFVAAMAF